MVESTSSDSAGPAGADGRPDQRTRVLLMTNTVAVGGMEEHVRLIAQELDRERFEVDAVFPDWAATNDWADSLAAVADHFHQLTPDRRNGLRPYLRDSWRLWRLARGQRYEVAHVHGTSYHGHNVTVLVLRLAGVKRIYLTEHLAPETPQTPRTRRMRHAMTRLLTAVVCVSDNNRDARERNLGPAACPTVVVNNGIDVHRFDEVPSPEEADRLKREVEIPPEATVVGTAIRFEPDKGVDDLIRSFALVIDEHPDTVLLLLGDGSSRAELEALADEVGVAPNTRFAGFQSDPQRFIRLMDVFILPVPFGSASIGLLEAMAMARPCIITFGGRKEAVLHGECGYCAEPHDPASIAQFTNLLVSDPARRAEFGSRARRRVEADYSATRVARELERLYVSSEPAT